jgi:hypothetical protein
MAAADAARPPTDQGDNGEEVLRDEGAAPAAEARRQAEQITEQRPPSGMGSGPARKDGQRQHDPSGG